MTNNTQPEALRLANVCSNLTRYSMDAHLIAAELRRQHARIAELEAELGAVGAGGVQALSAAPEAFLKSVTALCSHRGYSPANIEAWDKYDKWIADLWRQAEAMLAASPTPPAEQAAPKAAPKQEAQEPALFVSPKQLAALTDPNDSGGATNHGRYLSARKTSKGLFTQPLYAAPQPAPDCHHRPPCEECAARARMGEKI